MHIQEIFNAIHKNHHYEYLVIDRDMTVIEFSDRVIDYCDEKLLKDESIDIYNLVPEFYGLETQFKELFEKKCQIIEIPKVRKNEEQYANISVHMGREKEEKIETLIILFENITEYVLMHQRSVQDRNEKTLLLYELEKKNISLQKYNEEMEQLVETETKKIAKFINEYENALNFSTLFCRMSTKGIIVKSSQAFDELFGYMKGKLFKQKYKTLLKPSKIAFFNDILHHKIREQRGWHGIIKHQNRNGEILHLQSAYVPILNIDGEVEEIISFFVDLSENIKLDAAIITTQQEVIATMGAIGETRSKETGDHVLRVAEYSKLLALKLGLSAKEAEEIRMASPMHDIGKVGIKDAILNKPSKLTNEEFFIMKTHTKIGYNMLMGSNQKLLQTAAIIAHEHHEKWDGTGYPRALSGENIHLYGRITAISDVFDALGHNRVYKKSWPLELILDYLKSEKGKHFDPTLVDIFLENIDEFLEIKNMLNDN